MPDIIVKIELPLQKPGLNADEDKQYEYIEACRDFITEACRRHGQEVGTQELEDYLEDKRNGW